MTAIVPTEDDVLKIVETYRHAPSRGDIAIAISERHPEYRGQTVYETASDHLRRFLSVAALDKALDALLERGELIRLRGSEIKLTWYAQRPNAWYYYTPNTLLSLRAAEHAQQEEQRRRKARLLAEAEVLINHANEVADLVEKYLLEEEK